MVNFAHRDKLRRSEKARSLLKEGRTVSEIAEYFDVSEDTVKKYLEDVSTGHQRSLDEKEEVSLFDFGSGEAKMDEYFTQEDGGHRYCAVCKIFMSKSELHYLDETPVCKECFRTSDGLKDVLLGTRFKR